MHLSRFLPNLKSNERSIKVYMQFASLEHAMSTAADTIPGSKIEQLNHAHHY